jgi:regulatory protein YycI of two-component signal transduction system YycFG
MIKTTVFIIVLLIFIAILLFVVIDQQSQLNKRISILEDEKNPHNFSHPSSKMHKDFDSANLK